MRYSGRTDTGKLRTENQDVFSFYSVSDCLVALLCDGVGGYVGGEDAAATAMQVFSDKLKEKITALRDNDPDGFFDNLSQYIEKFFNIALDVANEAVIKRGKQTGKSKMCTTLVCALFADKKVYTFNVGDSRIYDLCDVSTPITKDQSLVQHLIDRGEITEEEGKNHPQKNVILSMVGNEQGAHGNYNTFDLQNHARYMLCSDGLSDYMDIADFSDLLSIKISPEHLCDKLIERANALGGKDNITVMIIENEE